MKKIFSFLTMLLLTCSMAWAAPQTNVGTYSTQVITEDWLTSTWTFITPGSQVNAVSTKDVDFIYAPSSSGKMKFTSSNGFSWLGESNGYVYVPAGSAGTISLTPKSSSESRYLQLYVNGESAGNNKRLWSKYNATPTSDGKKGPQSFTFTAADLTTIGDSTFLHFRDNNTEMKIASISITLTSGTYADCEAPATALTLSSNAAATVYVGDEITFSTTGGNGAVVSIEGANSETITANVWTATVGTHTFTATQPKNGDYCAQESELVLTVLEQTPVTAVTVAGSEAAYKGDLVTYTATAENAAEYRWKVNGAIQAGADEATFTYNATATGTFAIVCEARNDFNAAGAWIASDAKNLVVSYLYGEFIRATLTSNTAATVTGLLTGTAEMNISTSKETVDNKDGYKLSSNGQFLGIKELSSSLQEGDTAIVYVTKASANLQLFSDKGTTLIGEMIGGVAVGENKIVLNSSAAGKKAIYLYRADSDKGGGNMNPYVYSLSVVRPMPIVSEAWESLTIDNGPTSYNRTGTVVNVVDAYLDPKVVVTKHVVYADATEANVDVEVTDLEVEGNQYVGHVTIGGDVYTINIAKSVSYTVTYMDGVKVLGTEEVAIYHHPAKYASHQYKALHSFVGWYNDPDLAEGHKVANIASQIINADATYYGKWNKVYASSINIEQLILNNSTKYDLMSQMGALGYASNISNSLDSLNDEKSKRNEPYLGLKVKAAGKLLDFRVAAGQTVKVKFGTLPEETPLVSIDGGTNYAAMTISEGIYTYTAEAETVISIKTASDNTIIFKQIMIDEDIKDVILPSSDAKVTLSMNGWASYAANKKYTVSGAKVYKAKLNNTGDAVILTEVASAVVPAGEGIILKGVEGATVTIATSEETASDFTDNQLEGAVAATPAPANAYVISTNAGVTAFNPCQTGIMIPAHKAYMIIAANPGAPAVRIIFAENNATDIKSIEDSEKAVKFIENGKLYIQKNGVVYDVTGAKIR